MGNLFSGTTKTTSKSEPWKPQGDALKNIFGKAENIFADKEGTPFYQGDLYAGMDPATRQAVEQMLAYTKGAGQQTADGISAAGQQITNPGAYNGALSQFSQSAGTDPTQGNIAAATAYANNPAIDGMIDAASRDVNRNLYEQQIPGINMAATGTGNVNSSRAGVAEGIARRGAQDQIGDISANIRGDAFNRGLSLAESGRVSNMGAQGQAAGLYGQQFGQGIATQGAGRDMVLGNAGAAIDASTLFQKDAQGRNDAEFARWQGNDTRDSDLLNRYYSLIGANNWGGTQTNTQKSSPSVFSTLIGGAATLGGLGLFGGAKGG